MPSRVQRLPKRDILVAFARPHPDAGQRAILTRSFLIQSALAMLLAFAVRLGFLVLSRGMLDADEAVLGVQAERILQGAHPIYFYGQAYMGSWDAYLLAPLIAMFGPSAGALHAVTLLESLLLVPLTGALAIKLYGQRALLPALLVTALLPLFDTTVELRMLGGYVETLVLGAALMLLSTLIVERWDQARPTTVLWIVSGFLTGLGLWIDLLITYYVVACALWLAPLALARLLGGQDTAAHRSSPRPALATGMATLLAACVGAAPALYFAFTQHFANVSQFLQPTQRGGLPNVLRPSVLEYYALKAVPVVLGMRSRWPIDAPALVALALGVMAGIVALCAVGYTVARLIAPSTSSSNVRPLWRRNLVGLGASTRQRWNDAFPLILGVVITLVFWRSSVTNAPINTYVYPERYVVPLITTLALLLARLVGDLGMGGSAHETSIRPQFTSGMTRWIGLVLLLVTLATYTAPYALTDATVAMQSPFTPGNTFPVGNPGLVSYLEGHQIHDVWANHWVGDVVMYLSNQQILCADYVGVVVSHAQKRFPEALDAVSAANHPSFIVHIRPGQAKTAAELALDNLGVTYKRARFGNLVVITPLSRTVRPQEIVSALMDGYSFN